MTPIVVNLTDDNADGQITLADTPDVVFISTTDNGNGVLRAVSGKDGTPIWDLTDGPRRVQPFHPIAAADLDGDGIVEIVAPGVQSIANPGGRLLIF